MFPTRGTETPSFIAFYDNYKNHQSCFVIEPNKLYLEFFYKTLTHDSINILLIFFMHFNMKLYIVDKMLIKYMPRVKVISNN